MISKTLLQGKLDIYSFANNDLFYLNFIRTYVCPLCMRFSFSKRNAFRHMCTWQHENDLKQLDVKPGDLTERLRLKEEAGYPNV